MSFLMQARSSTSGALVTWTTPSPDYAGAYFPGPGTALDVAGMEVKATSANQLIGKPEGRLTLTSATPITTGDVTGATSIFYTPHTGNGIDLFDGSRWQHATFAEVSLALGTLVSGKNYDVFAKLTGAGIVLMLSAAWTSDVARADAISRLNGTFVKTSDQTQRYLGTIRTTSTTTTEDSVTNRFVFNAYNRFQRELLHKASVASWTYATLATWRQANALTSNQFNYVDGLGDVFLDARVDVPGQNSTSGGGQSVGIGIDSTTTNTADIYGNAPATGSWGLVSAIYKGTPGLGYHSVKWLEYTPAGTATWYGTNSNTTFMTSGISGSIAA